MDLSTPDGPGTLVAAAGPRVDVLVNNVGSAHPRPGGFLEITDEMWRATLELDLMASVRAVRAVVPVMLAYGGGAIVNIGSVNARLPDPLVLDYSAAKAAAGSMAKSLSKELGPHGIRVNTVDPGPVATDLWLGKGGVAEVVGGAHGASPEDVAAGAAAVDGHRSLHPARGGRRPRPRAGQLTVRQRDRVQRRDRRRADHHPLASPRCRRWTSPASGVVRLCRRRERRVAGEDDAAAEEPHPRVGHDRDAIPAVPEQLRRVVTHEWVRAPLGVDQERRALVGVGPATGEHVGGAARRDHHRLLAGRHLHASDVGPGAVSWTTGAAPCFAVSCAHGSATDAVGASSGQCASS